jgi:hypothetical protein
MPQGNARIAGLPTPQAAAPGGTLEFAKSNATATLVDFNSDDAVDILGNLGDTHYHLSLASNVLSVQDKFGDPLGTFTLVSTTANDISQFAVNNDSGSGALVTAPCFIAGARGMFQNAAQPLILHPAFASWTWESAACAPIVVAGPKLAALHRRLAERAARLDMRKRRRLSPARAMGA